MKKRARVEIISDILFFIKERGSAKPTNILYKINLSVPLLNKYLNMLLNDALITTTNIGKSIVYSITEKGLEFLRVLQELNHMTEAIEIYKDKRDAK